MHVQEKEDSLVIEASSVAGGNINLCITLVLITLLKAHNV